MMYLGVGGGFKSETPAPKLFVSSGWRCWRISSSTGVTPCSRLFYKTTSVSNREAPADSCWSQTHWFISPRKSVCADSEQSPSSFSSLPFFGNLEQIFRIPWIKSQQSPDWLTFLSLLDKQCNMYNTGHISNTNTGICGILRQMLQCKKRK